MTDAELITQGRKYATMIQRSQLELGKLALEYAPIGEPGVKTGTYDRLQEYADAIGVDAGTLRNYRTTAAAWQAQQEKVKGYGFTVLKALTSVARKDDLIEAMAQTEPPTPSKRWTADAAVTFARDEGYWSHSGAERSIDMLGALRRTRTTLAKFAEADLTPDEARDMLAVVEEVQREVEGLKAALQTRLEVPS